jgi:hypothetical protein
LQERLSHRAQPKKNSRRSSLSLKSRNKIS